VTSPGGDLAGRTQLRARPKPGIRRDAPRSLPRIRPNAGIHNENDDIALAGSIGSARLHREVRSNGRLKKHKDSLFSALACLKRLFEFQPLV
jgi:hypothetical protein